MQCEVSQQMKWEQIGNSVLLNNLILLIYTTLFELNSIAGDCWKQKKGGFVHGIFRSNISILFFLELVSYSYVFNLNI